MEKNKGITLIALVVTIIVLIILAGVSISLVLGDNGIITKAKQAKVTYSQAQAREKLEMVLGELQADKATNPEYDQEDYIDKKIEDNDMEIEGNIVIVDGWQFEIDRSVPKIVNELPKLTEEEMLKPIITKVTTNIEGKKIKISIKLRNEEGRKITYSIKKVGASEEIENTGEINELTYTFETGLEEGQTYEITITATNDYGTSNKTISDILINYSGYDVVRYMRLNSLSAEQFGFNVTREGHQADPSGSIGLGIAHASGSASVHAGFSITPEQLNIFNLELRKVKAIYALSADGNSWGNATMRIYYSDDDYDDVDTGAVRNSAPQGSISYVSVGVEAELRNEPVQKIEFHIWGWDGDNGGFHGYIQNILLNPEG